MKTFVAAILAAAVAVPVQAATLTLNPITAAWSNVVGAGATLDVLNNGTADAGIRWGVPAVTGGSKSGYQFTSAVTPLVTNFVVNGSSANFTIGNFTHINQPIFAPSISSARLTLTYGITVNATNLGNFNAVFDATHTETTNNLAPCPFGGANNQGVNINGCSDRVQFSFNNSASTFFNLNGVDHTLDFSGFNVNGNTISEFLTIEAQENTAGLVGRIRAATTGPNAIPEPASWAMMLFGFGAVGMAARRKRQVVAA